MPTPKQVSQKITRLARQRDLLEQELRDTVAVGRSYNADGEPLLTWWEVGEALGVTRQAAAQRYADLELRAAQAAAYKAGIKALARRKPGQ